MKKLKFLVTVVICLISLSANAVERYTSLIKVLSDGGVENELLGSDEDWIRYEGYGPWIPGCGNSESYYSNANLYTMYDKSTRARSFRLEAIISPNEHTDSACNKTGHEIWYTTRVTLHKKNSAGSWVKQTDKEWVWSGYDSFDVRNFYIDYPLNANGDPIKGEYLFRHYSEDHKTKEYIKQQIRFHLN